MKKFFVATFMLLILNTNIVNASEEIGKDARRDINCVGTPYNNRLKKSNHKQNFSVPGAGDIRRYASSYHFGYSRRSVSATLSLGFGPATISISPFQNSGGWSRNANGNKPSTVEMEITGDIRESRACNGRVSKKLITKVEKPIFKYY